MRTLIVAAQAAFVAVCLTAPAAAQETAAATPPDAVPAAAPAAPARVSLMDYLVNQPQVTNWSVWGTAPPAQAEALEGVAGGSGIRVHAPGAGDPWTVGAVMPTHAAIKTGDVLFLAVWVKAERPLAGGETALVPRMRVEPREGVDPKPAILEVYRATRRPGLADDLRLGRGGGRL